MIADATSKYDGDRAQEIRVWGRRRLLILKDILPDSDGVEVQLLGSGMPSFWTVHVDGVELMPRERSQASNVSVVREARQRLRYEMQRYSFLFAYKYLSFRQCPNAAVMHLTPALDALRMTDFDMYLLPLLNGQKQPNRNKFSLLSLASA